MGTPSDHETDDHGREDDRDPMSTQARILLYADIVDPDCPVRPADDLSGDDLADVPVLHNARRFLEAVREEEAVPATKTLGNLSRRFSTRMFRELDWSDGLLEDYLSSRSHVDEHELSRLFRLRVVLQRSGLLRKYRGEFMLTKRGEALLDPTRIGELYRTLFVGWFGKTNMALIDGMPGDPAMQDHIPLTLWLLGREARDWTPAQRLAEILPHDPDLWAESSARIGWPDQLAHAFEARVFRPFVEFGLMEREPASDRPWYRLARWRVTPRFDRLITTDLSAATPESRREDLVVGADLIRGFTRVLSEQGYLTDFATMETYLVLFSQWIRIAVRTQLEEAFAAGSASGGTDEPTIELTPTDLLDVAPEFVEALDASPVVAPGGREQAADLILVFATWTLDIGVVSHAAARTATAFALAVAEGEYEPADEHPGTQPLTHEGEEALREARRRHADDVVTLKITLRGTEPPVWRRLEVPASYDLGMLHRTLNAAMGWLDCHLHEFDVEGRLYGVPDTDWFPEQDTTMPEERIVLGDLAEVGVDRFIYRYDFGDGWTHTVALEGVGPAEPGTTYPRCVAGRRAPVPEDCGGPGGFAEFVEAMADTSHPEHDELRDWCGADYDPTEFDPAEVSEMLRRMATYLERERGGGA